MVYTLCVTGTFITTGSSREGGSGAPPPLSADTPATEPETHPCSDHRGPPIHRAAASNRLSSRRSSRLRGGRRLSDGGGGAQHCGRGTSTPAPYSVLYGRRTELLAVGIAAAVVRIPTVGCVVDHCAAISSRRQPRGRPHTYSSRGLVGAHAYIQHRQHSRCMRAGVGR